jgi:hypothetical protein
LKLAGAYQAPAAAIFSDTVKNQLEKSVVHDESEFSGLGGANSPIIVDIRSVELLV